MFKDLTTVITIISLSVLLALASGCESKPAPPATSGTSEPMKVAKAPVANGDVEFERIKDVADDDTADAKDAPDVEFERVADPKPAAAKTPDVQFEKVGGQGEVEFERVKEENTEVEFEKVGGEDKSEVEFEKVGGEVEFEKVEAGSKDVEFERVKD